MKALARSYVWWKGIDSDIEALSKHCMHCSNVANSPAKVYHPWEYASSPWQRIHIDYLGPFMNTYILIIVDAYTKWIEAIPMKNITANATIRILRDIFSRFGLPVTVVSDNGSQLKSTEFEMFLKSNGIHHKCIAPYHPATNGQAERYVQVVKKGLRSMMNEPGDLHFKLCQLLLQYRKLPNSTTGISPAELMFKRPIRTKIDLVKRNVKSEQDNRERRICMARKFSIGDRVQVRCYANKVYKWKYGVVTSQTGHLHYNVIVDGIVHNYHVDQMKATAVENRQYVPTKEIQEPQVKPKIEPPPTEVESEGLPVPEGNHGPNDTIPILDATIPTSSAEEPIEREQGSTIPRRSTRTRKPPTRLDL
ncbi:uncharacterized protein K02A2.6-like [Photinus pyralis]|uniref:uncharacterized protein K02A2.6-like n=1 Tax=Photinus pyralis TaxID=7054 RepID=UPI0012677D23|nr:uncharacterized protein K02A2.6-like [Photinus pyralis]